MNQKFETVRIKTETKDALKHVARLKGWKIVEAIDRATKALAKQERISVRQVESSAA